MAVAILGEPVGAVLIAAMLLGKTPGLLEGVGGAVVLAGVYLVLRGASRGDAPRAPIEG